MVLGTTIGRGTRGGGQAEVEGKGEGQSEGNVVVMGVTAVVAVVVRSRDCSCGGLEGGSWEGGRCGDPRFMHAYALALGATQACMYLGRLGWIGGWRMGGWVGRQPLELGSQISTLISASGLQPVDLQVEGRLSVPGLTAPDRSRGGRPLSR